MKILQGQRTLYNDMSHLSTAMLFPLTTTQSPTPRRSCFHHC